MQQDIFKRPKVTLKGLSLLFGGLLITGVIIGAIASFVGNYIYLILLFPMVMGLIAGFVLKSIVVSEKIRSSFVVVIAGIFSAVLIYGSMHFFDYLQFRNSLAKVIQQRAIAANGTAAPEENVQAYIDYLLAEETNFPGFLGFVLLEAKEGMTISEVGAGSHGTPLNLKAFTWLLWFVEMCLIGGIAMGAAYKIAKDLFCEQCDTWVPQQEHVGGVKPEFLDQAVERIKCRDFAGLAQMLQLDSGFPSVEFYTRTCKTCNTFPFYLMGFGVSAGRKGQTQSKLLVGQVLTASERFAFTSALAAPNPEVKSPLGK